MCTAPNRLADGTLVGCRNCWQCKETAVDDWSGRCIAESKTATAPFWITLTYGRELDSNWKQTGPSDHLRASLLTYSDVQKYFKRLRKRRKIGGKWVSYPCRYFCVGEYGSEKGRAHWHMLVFWQGAVPPHEPSTRDRPVRFDEPHWPHGFSQWEPLSGLDGESVASAVRYCCKYIQKDIGKAEQQRRLAMSKKPLIGAAWLHEYAAQHVRQGLAPQDLHYSFPDVLEKDGRRKRFMLRPGSASADLFCQTYLDLWAEAHDCEPLRNRDGVIYNFTGRGNPPPPSELIEAYGDKLAAKEVEQDKWHDVVAERERALRLRKYALFPRIEDGTIRPKGGGPL